VKRYSADVVMAGLKDFQRTTVDHVVDRFYGPSPTRRFLVADETGLGKSLVARGVIAKTLERLQDDDSVDRIDVVYVCSNQDIAAQNVARLRVTSGESVTLSSRLTLLAKHTAQLEGDSTDVAKPVNLVAFTPGTSFDRGWRTGMAEERAMLYLLLEQARGWDGWMRHAAIRAFQGTLSTPERFNNWIDWLRQQLVGGIDEQIRSEFLLLAEARGLLDSFDGLLGRIGRSRRLPDSLREECFSQVGMLRTVLAQAGVTALEPDLVILDEFQRFRHLLDLSEGGEAAELAHHLFDYGDAKVLLLSATPYKPFTLAEEAAAGDDHHRDFLRTLNFLNGEPGWSEEVRQAFDAYREAVVGGMDAERAAYALRRLLLQVMCRTERPSLVQSEMLLDRQLVASDLRPVGVRGYVTLTKLARAVDAPMTIEYWKSAPYFLNFVEGYKLGERLRAELRSGERPDLKPLLDSTHRLETSAFRGYDPIELGNARLRRLAEDTVSQGWWQLLWVPPSMPHYALGSPFAELAGMTKRLIFSSWNATPTAVAGLLSYEVERRIVEGSRLTRNDPAERRRIATRLDYRLDGDRPAAMSTLALFWPHPRLADLGDPLAVARRRPDEMLGLREIEQHVRTVLATAAASDLRLPRHASGESASDALFRWVGAGPPSELNMASVVDLMSGSRGSEEPDRSETTSRLRLHVENAVQIALGAAERRHGSECPPEVLDDLAALSIHSPGNVAWRAVGRVIGQSSFVTEAGHWQAAAVVASGLRSLFNRVEATLLLDRLELDSVYWRAVLRYIGAGGLQAVLDEYFHHLRSTRSDAALTDDVLLEMAKEAGDALALRPSTYRAFDPDNPDTSIPLLSRFALRYGGRRDDPNSARHPEVRQAFNSPFWPFIVATTSAGQEGIDFHWWCSAVVHWNTPANPVDFEQREGRIHRFGGHAIRRNVAAKHRAAGLRGMDDDVWRVMYDAARAESDAHGDFAPYWVYPGKAMIERHVLPYPLSRDSARLEQLQRDLALYRLAFGQPRQEDMLELLRRNGVSADEVAAAALDLRPWSNGVVR
jgi:hypothetical protein